MKENVAAKSPARSGSPKVGPRSLLLIADPPCDTCRFSRKCGAEALACVDFETYYLSGKVVNTPVHRRRPTAARYQAIMNSNL